MNTVNCIHMQHHILWISETQIEMFVYYLGICVICHVEKSFFLCSCRNKQHFSIFMPTDKNDSVTGLD